MIFLHLIVNMLVSLVIFIKEGLTNTHRIMPMHCTVYNDGMHILPATSNKQTIIDPLAISSTPRHWFLLFFKEENSRILKKEDK